MSDQQTLPSSVHEYGQRPSENTATSARWGSANICVWTQHDEIEIALVPDADGGFSVYAPSLRGLITEGDTEEEAKANAKEAAAALLESFKEAGERIPWSTTPREPEPNETRCWILVDGD